MAIGIMSSSKASYIKIDLENPGTVINRNVQGQFMEHLGRCVYEGIWVGEGSTIPHIEGYRKDVVEALKSLHVPVLRWPGGCYADEYHWRNGIGPRDQRPKTINTTWGGVIDDNAFGTHEFMRFAELIGAEVYINGNIGTGTPQEMAEWLEYMTSDSNSTLVNLRRKNGHEKPWRVHFFGLGNECWGCGGSMRPEYYADLFKHFATFLKSPADNRPIIIASGGHTDLTVWTQTLMEQVPETFSMRMDAITHHYYTLPTDDWKKHGKATGFSEAEWFSTFRNTMRMESYIQKNLTVMDQFDPQKRVGLFVDEWGTWYETEEGHNPSFLYQQNTLRDALVAAINLNIFHKYSDRIRMTNIAQMINVLQAMILTDKERMVLTPTYHVYKMFIPFQDAIFIPISVENNPHYRFNDDEIPQISASAALTKAGEKILSLVNIHPNQMVKIEIKGNYSDANGTLLTADKVDTHNTFDSPDFIYPQPFHDSNSSGQLTIHVPSKSVMVISIS